MIQVTRLAHHVSIEHRRDLGRFRIVYHPHCPNHRTKPGKLHRGREMDHLARTLIVSSHCMRSRQGCKFWILQVALDDVLNGKVSVVKGKRGLKWLFPVREAVAHKVYQFVPVQHFRDPRNARLLFFDAHECCYATNAPADIRQLGTDGMEFACTHRVSLTNGDEPGFLARMKAVGVGVYVET